MNENDVKVVELPEPPENPIDEGIVVPETGDVKKA